jgi:hypothetical protein
VEEYDPTTGARITTFHGPTGLQNPEIVSSLPAAVPEPGGSVLLALGASAVLGWRRRSA